MVFVMQHQDPLKRNNLHNVSPDFIVKNSVEN
jgi:hypothetical protein